MNYSKKKRGIRTKEDFQNIHELAECVKTHGITRRNLASLLMGTCHDPLGVIDPYANNLKIIYRRVCRTQPVPNWDIKLQKDEEDAIIKACSYFFLLENVLFERRAIFSDAAEIVFLFYLDGSSTDLNGVSIIVKNTFPNNDVISRCLRNKSHINGGDVTTTPRAELQAAHLCSRLYALLQDQLREFLLLFSGKIKFEILSDSEIVLNQIGCLPYMFKPWVGARIQEIQENVDKKVGVYACSYSR